MPADDTSTNMTAFRRVISLPSGVHVLLRILGPDDRDQLVALYSCATTEDLIFFRDDVRDASMVAHWAEHVNLAHVIPIVALVHNRIVGEAMLQLGRGCDRHVAEVRIFLCKEFRGRGLGNTMIEALISIARELDLHILFARVAASQGREIRAFEALGFEKEYRFKDRLINPAGDTQDVIEVTLYLKSSRVLF